MAYWRVGQRWERIPSGTWQHHAKVSFPSFPIQCVLTFPICNPPPIILFRVCSFLRSFLHYSCIHPFNKYLPSTCWDIKMLAPASLFLRSSSCIRERGRHTAKNNEHRIEGEVPTGHTHPLTEQGRHCPHSRGEQAEAQRAQ